MPSYTDSPMSEDMEDEEGGSKGTLKLKRLKTAGNRLAVRIHLDGPADNFVTAAVVSASSELVDQQEDDALSSDDEIFKDVRAFVRQTMGKPALVKAEAGICGGGIKPEDQGDRPATPWGEGLPLGGNYITVRHPAPDAPIDTPPLPSFDDGKSIPQSGSIRYPLPTSCKHWFNPEWVSDLERAELRNFGISESTYRVLRDKIIDGYNVDPSKYLSIRNAREATGYGEMGVLTKVWGFLDYWGIINYVADPTTAPRYAKKLIDFPIGRPSQPLEQILCCSCRKACMYTAFALKPEAAPLIPKEQLVAARFCSACVNSGSFPPFFSKASFEQVDVVLPGTVTKEFTEEETMKLFEAIQRYGTDWESVARMVGAGKTAAQCLLHFIQIPLGGDKLIESAPKRESGFKPKLNPFRDESKDLLPLISLLSTAVPPQVASQVAGLR